MKSLLFFPTPTTDYISIVYYAEGAAVERCRHGALHAARLQPLLSLRIRCGRTPPLPPKV